MLKDILHNEEIDFIAKKHSDALTNYANLFNNEKKKYKFKLLNPLKDANFRLDDAKKFNFKASKKLWASCSNKKERNPGGRPCLNNMIVENIHTHMNNKSSIAANRYLKKCKSSARYRDTTYLEAFNSFQMKDKLVISTFKRKMKKIYKKPHRFSDLCDVCENGKVRCLT